MRHDGAARPDIEAEANSGQTLPVPDGQWPFLFVIDEMPQLGCTQVVEDAVSIARGANIQPWMIARDRSQLRNVYPRWLTLIANAEAQMYFQPSDLGTAPYISAQLGEYKDIQGSRAPFASPQELMGESFRDEVVIRLQRKEPRTARCQHFRDSRICVNWLSNFLLNLLPAGHDQGTAKHVPE